MRLLLSPSGRASAMTALCLLLAALAGCASKNPLMEEPAASRAGPASSPVAAATPAPGKTGASQDAGGVQTVKQHRFLGFLSPYRPDVQQGNFVSREMVSQLRTGMTPDQVRFVLGTPLLTDIFHADRWDYPFRLQKGNGEVISSRVTVFFKDKRLDHFDGGNLPTEKDYLNLLVGKQQAQKTASSEEAAKPASPIPPAPLKDPSDPATAPTNK